MDHCIERVEIDMEIHFDEFYKEWISKKYKNFAECPNYSDLKALVDCSNVLRKHIGWELLSIRKMIIYRS